MHCLLHSNADVGKIVPCQIVISLFIAMVYNFMYHRVIGIILENRNFNCNKIACREK